ncbi:hypothetical protein BZA05DRAFT_12807 [Tricharina praecox]|uniref:uncharacterized protein n=1 Tax=Tricharina praecox TaxID=43433 RepID=UPI00221ECBBB|nr:uncharacterized protein BZA05DRAFT_12807 [Tricharina praecox]KAI5858762.1 hypothetical protein BZA05DRAFT_12807 [Tricharina praecox]
MDARMVISCNLSLACPRRCYLWHWPVAELYVACVSTLSDRGLSAPTDEFDDDEHEAIEINRTSVPGRRTTTGAKSEPLKKSHHRFPAHHHRFYHSRRACLAGDTATAERRVNFRGRAQGLAQDNVDHDNRYFASPAFDPNIFAAIHRAPALTATQTPRRRFLSSTMPCALDWLC